MRRKTTKKRGRKQSALRCLLWILILLMLNTVFHGIPLFHFQARDNMEIQYGLDQTRVVWEETAERGWWDGKFHCLSVNDNMAVFYNLHGYTIAGWYSSVIQILNKNTTEILDAAWSGQYDADYHKTVWAMGYVASDRVECIEYTFIWSEKIVETYLVSDEHFVWDGEDRYYVYDTGASMFMENPASPGEEVMISDVIVTARNGSGEIIYQKYLYPSWKAT